MSLKRAKEHLEKYGLDEEIILTEDSSETVELAAKALGVTEDEIAKTLSYNLKDESIVIVLAGERRVSNRKFKDIFKEKARMVPFKKVKDVTGFEPGGVCPFGLKKDIKVYLDNSLKDYDYIYPACGTGNSAIKMTPEKLEEVSEAEGWIDVSE